MAQTEQYQEVDKLQLQPYPAQTNYLTHPALYHPPPREKEQITNHTNRNPSRLTLNFGAVGPSPGPTPWVLERKNRWDFTHWISPSGGRGLHALQQAQVLQLVLSEEFLFDTIDPNSNTFDGYTAAIYRHSLLTPWEDILATLRHYLTALDKQIDLVEIYVQGLESNGSMSDYGIGEEQSSTAVLRPTERVYAGFIDEFTKFSPGTVGEVRLGGLFPGDWAGLIETKMGSRVEKDFSEFVKEIRWWSTDDIGMFGGVGLSGFGGLGLEANFETLLRKRHAGARWAMLNGAGNDYDECDSDPGYESEELL